MEWIVRIGKKDDEEGYQYAAFLRHGGYLPTGLIDRAHVFFDYMEAHEVARTFTYGEVIPKTLLAIGTRVVCFKGCGDETYKEENDTHYGLISGNVTIVRNANDGGSGREGLAYIVGLDEPFTDPFGGTISYIVVHPGSLREY